MDAHKVSPDAMVVEPRRTRAHDDRPMHDGERVQTPGRDRTLLLGLLAAVLLAALVVLAAWALNRPETALSSQPAHHDSGIAQALRERDDALVAQHDSGIAQALRDRERARTDVYDSGIARLLREREQAGQSPSLR